MKKPRNLFALLLLAAVALSGCAALRTLFAGEAAHPAKAPDEAAQPAAPSLIFYESYASW